MLSFMIDAADERKLQTTKSENESKNERTEQDAKVEAERWREQRNLEN